MITYLWNAIVTFFTEFSTADAIRLEQRLQPVNEHMQIVRYCTDLTQDALLEVCIRYDLQAFYDVGVQDYGIELFSTQAF